MNRWLKTEIGSWDLQNVRWIGAISAKAAGRVWEIFPFFFWDYFALYPKPPKLASYIFPSLATTSSCQFIILN